MRKLSAKQISVLKRRVYSANYRARKDFASREEIFLDEVLGLLQSNPHCDYCGRALSAGTLSLDHLRPLVDGGRNHISNIVLSCRRDNRYKSAIPAEQFKAFLAHLGEAWQKFFFSHYRPHSHRR